MVIDSAKRFYKFNFHERLTYLGLHKLIPMCQTVCEGCRTRGRLTEYANCVQCVIFLVDSGESQVCSLPDVSEGDKQGAGCRDLLFVLDFLRCDAYFFLRLLMYNRKAVKTTGESEKKVFAETEKEGEIE